MTDRTVGPIEDPDSESNLPDAPLRPIPDGGLGSAMPDWLQQPPAWKRASGHGARKAIPDPDTSVIDPRQMIDIDDLPQWLQQIARRGVESRPETPNLPAPSSVERSSPLSIPEEKGIAHEKPVPMHLPEENAMVEIRASEPPEHWWLSDSVVGALFIAIILTIIYVVLVASNVL